MTDSRNLLLQKVLPLVPFDGWTDYTLREAAKAAGVNVAAVFPGGVADCIDYFFDTADEALKVACPAETLATLRMPARIEKLILARLDHFQSDKEALRRAIAQRALPWNALRATKSLYKTVDTMWRLAGDNATDFNFYTKRMTLAGVYSSTLLFWLNEHSANHAETAEFLKRRLQNVADFGKWKQSRFGAAKKRTA